MRSVSEVGPPPNMSALRLGAVPPPQFEVGSLPAMGLSWLAPARTVALPGLPTHAIEATGSIPAPVQREARPSGSAGIVLPSATAAIAIAVAAGGAHAHARRFSADTGTSGGAGGDDDDTSSLNDGTKSGARSVATAEIAAGCSADDDCSSHGGGLGGFDFDEVPRPPRHRAKHPFPPPQGLVAAGDEPPQASKATRAAAAVAGGARRRDSAPAFSSYAHAAASAAAAVAPATTLHRAIPARTSVLGQSVVRGAGLEEEEGEGGEDDEDDEEERDASPSELPTQWAGPARHSLLSLAPPVAAGAVASPLPASFVPPHLQMLAAQGSALGDRPQEKARPRNL